MKVVLLGTAYPYRGGLALFNERLIEQFRREGDEVHLFTFTLQYPSFLFPGKTQYSNERADVAFPIERTLSSINPISWHKTAGRINRIKPDILIIKYWLPFMAPAFGTVARLVRRHGTKVIAIADNILPHERRFFDRAFTGYFTRNVDGWVAMSESVLKDISLFDKTAPRVLTPHPLFDNFGERMDRKEAQLSLNLKEEETNLLFFGLVREYKGLDLLFKALTSPRLKDQRLHLTVAGEFYDDYSKYERMVSELGLTERVSMENRFIDDRQVKRYFCAADLVVLPYKSATQSGVTQIAFHFSKPMLVTRVGGLAEIVREGKSGYVCEPNAESIAESLEDFCENRRDFSQTLEQEKQRFSWAKMTEKIRQLYKETIKR